MREMRVTEEMLGGDGCWWYDDGGYPVGIRAGTSTDIDSFLSARRILEEIGLGLHELTIFGLLDPGLISGESRIVSGTGTVPELEQALSPSTLLAESLALLTLGAAIVAWDENKS